MEQILIQIPEGHVIDTEKSNLEEGKIVFKKKEVTPWRNGECTLTGYYVTSNSHIEPSGLVIKNPQSRNIFANKKQAKSMLAMAQLSQIIENDKRFGGSITNEEWLNHNVEKWLIDRYGNQIDTDNYKICNFRFLAFHTKEQRDLFLKENEDLIRQYYMLD